MPFCGDSMDCRCRSLIRAAAVLAVALTGVSRAEPEADSAAASPAAVAVPARLGVADAFAIALRNNKDIRAADLSARAAGERVTSAKGEFDPELFADSNWTERDTPVAGVTMSSDRESEGRVSAGVRKRFATGTDLEMVSGLGYVDDDDPGSMLNPLYDSGVALVLSQDILRGFGSEVNRTGIDIAANNRGIAEESLRDTVIGNLLEVELAYWDLYFAREDLKVRQTQLDRATRLVEVAESQARVGEAAPIEITRARASAAAQDVEILGARNRIALLRTRLLRYLGVMDARTVEADFALADAPPEAGGSPALQASLDVAIQNRPDCIRANLLVENAARREKRAANDRLPSLKLYGGVRLEGTSDGFSDSRSQVTDGDYDTWQVGATFSYPIPNRSGNADYREAKLERSRAATIRRAVLENAVREVADASLELRTAESQIDSATRSRQLAEELLVAEEKSFRLGRSDSLDVLTAQASLAAAERDLIRARVTHAKALAYLYRVRGDFLGAKGLEYVSAE